MKWSSFLLICKSDAYFFFPMTFSLIALDWSCVILITYPSGIKSDASNCIYPYDHISVGQKLIRSCLQLRPFFKMGISLYGKNLLPEGANSFLYEQFLIIWKITFTTLSYLPFVLLFISHVRNLRNGRYANDVMCFIILVLS